MKKWILINNLLCDIVIMQSERERKNDQNAITRQRGNRIYRKNDIEPKRKCITNYARNAQEYHNK